MKLTQKMIKYCAIAFAITIIVNIFYFILSVVNGFSLFTNDNKEVKTKLKSVTIDSDYASLSIDLKAASLKIEEGSSYKLETTNKELIVKSEDNKLTIKEDNIMPKGSKVILTIPKDTEFTNAKIDTGAGKIDIASLKSQKIDFDLGAGKITINNLEVSDEAKIDTGAGLTNINDANINDLDLDMGAGEVNIKGVITGDSKIDAGVGALNILLNNKLSNYKLIVSKGLGEIKINNKTVKSGPYGSGDNLITIDGGIGSITINTAQ